MRKAGLVMIVLLGGCAGLAHARTLHVHRHAAHPHPIARAHVPRAMERMGPGPYPAGPGVYRAAPFPFFPYFGYGFAW